MLHLVQVGNVVGVAWLTATYDVGHNFMVIQASVVVVLVGVAVIPSHCLFHLLVVLLAPCREAKVRHELGGCCATSISPRTDTVQLR